MLSTELVTDSAALTAKERAQIILQNSICEAVPTPQLIHSPLRSQSPELRNVAGDVHRRTDRVINVEAPPASRSDTKSTTRKRVDKKKRGKGGGFGYNGDSDSDEGGKEGGKREDRHGRATVKKPLPVADNDGAGPSDRTFGALSAEEQRLIQLRRTITAMGQQWEAIEKHHKKCKLRSEIRGPVLIGLASKTWTSLEPSEDLEMGILLSERYLEEYQKEALFGHIKDQGIQDKGNDVSPMNSRDNHLQDVLLSVEDALIRRCSNFLLSGYGTGEYSKVPQMCNMIMLMLKELWEEVNGKSHEQGEEASWQNLVARFMSKRCPRGARLDLLVENYFDFLYWDLEQKIVDQKAGRHATPPILTEKLHSSRCADGLTDEYISWAISILDPTELAKRRKNWSRDEAIRGFRSTFKNCRQAFVENPSDTGSFDTVSLVLSIGNKLVNTQCVSNEDLKQMGWIYEKSHRRFWRYERKRIVLPHIWQHRLGMKVESGYGLTNFDVVLCVGMDGEVVGIRTPSGIGWWTDDYNELGCSLPDLETFTGSLEII